MQDSPNHTFYVKTNMLLAKVMDSYTVIQRSHKLMSSISEISGMYIFTF